MNTDDEYRLSFYKTVSELNKEHGVMLVRHVETGRFYVEKELTGIDSEVFDLLKSMHFEGVPQIVEFVDNNDGSYTVIETFVNGRTLREIMDEEGCSDPDDASGLLVRLCDILEKLHGNEPPIIHRDIKPENIIVEDDGSVYLIDFDASRRYEEGKIRDTELIGTRKYAAPEQFGFSQSDSRTDIYALGKIGLEMINGSLSQSDDSRAEKLTAVLNRCISMDPEDRYGSAAELRRAILETCGRRGIKKDVAASVSEKAGRSKLKVTDQGMPPGLKMIRRLAEPSRIMRRLSRMKGTSQTIRE